jgi:hypothetical protein
MTLTLGTDSGAMEPGVDSYVTSSSRRLFLHTDDWELHVRYHKMPREVTAQSQVQAP